MFTFGLLANELRSLSPLPPAPIPAIFNLSLGATKPLPRTWRGTIKKPAAATDEFLINLRRDSETLFFFFIGVFMFKIISSRRRNRYMPGYGWLTVYIVYVGIVLIVQYK